MTTASAARIGQARDWELCDTYDQLGLAPDELRRVLLDLPDDWDDKHLRRLAVATHAVVSNLIGEMAGSRQSLAAALRALAGMAAAQVVQQPATTDEDDLEAETNALFEKPDAHGQASTIPDDDGDDDAEQGCAPERKPVVIEPSPWPEWAAPRVQAALAESQYGGWGGSKAPWRRLAGTTLPHVRQRPGKPATFTITDAEDYAALSAAYGYAKEASPRQPLLPLRACSAFAPPARTLTLEDLDQPLTVEIPSAWQFVAQLLVWGPDRGQERLIAWVASRAEKILPPSVDRPDGGLPTSGTMAGHVRWARSWFLAALDVAPGFNGLLNPWQLPIELDMERIANGVDIYVDRTAIPLHVFRRGLARARAVVAEYRQGNGEMRTGWFRHLRFLLVLGMLGDLGCRPQELAGVRPWHIRESFFEDPETGLRVAVTEVRITPLVKGRKRGRKRPVPQPRWKPIHSHTAADLRLWMALNAIAADDPRSIWVTYEGKDGRMSGDQLSDVLKSVSRGIARLPRLTGRAYTADNVRHMASLLAQDVGYSWLRGRPAALTQVSAYAFSEALLCHQPRSDMLGYMDVKRRPELWGARAALGAPGIPGTLALIHEDPGARLGWDIGAIQRAGLELELATTGVEALQRRIVQLELDEDAITEAPIMPPVPPGDVSDAEYRRIDLARDAAKEDRDRTLARIRRELRHCYREAQGAVERRTTANHAIRELQDGGYTRPIDDRDPTQLELDDEGRDGEHRVALDAETWKQAMDRAKLNISLLIDQPTAGPPRVRHILNLCEFAAVMGMTDRALRDRLAGRAVAFFPLTGADSPLVGEGRLRGIDVDKLSDEFKRRLLSEQLEMMEQFCAVPMGSTHYGGRRS